jgi:Fur family peroxide stress response transcriptional regulator
MKYPTFEEVQARMRRKGLRLTDQRRAILEALLQAEHHPTAEWIYGQVKNDLPGLSLGSVYRNLRVLVDQGLVKENKYQDGVTRYCTNLEPHHHLFCTECGRVEDVEVDIDGNLRNTLEQEHNFVIRSMYIEFRGVCSECAERWLR